MMQVSARATFSNASWREWLEEFPEYDRMGGHIPALYFERDVRTHLVKANQLSRPSKSDHQLLKSELQTHFDLIGSQLAQNTKGGLLAAVTGLIGLLGDFAIPGTSILLTWISGMLITGGAASEFSASREVKHIFSARDAVVLWLRNL